MRMQHFKGGNALNELKISIIVPIYKVEKYIHQCIDSVLNQTYHNIELILVDDGSPDKCPKICDEYEKKDNRVFVIHKQNGGLSDARNVGIRKATGEYITFLDSDDFWDDVQAIERLVKRVVITKPDVLNYSYKKYYEDSQEENFQFQNIQSRPIQLNMKAEQLDFLTKNHLYIASACNKLIRTKIFSDKMMFEPNRLSEDVEWCARLMLYAQSFDFVCENFYCYRQRSGSITHTIGAKYCYDLQISIVQCINIAVQSPKDTKTYLYRYVAYQYATFVAVQAIAEKCSSKCIDELANYKWVLEYHSGNKKVLYLNIICKVLGFKKMCSLIRCTKTIWNKWRVKR